MVGATYVIAVWMTGLGLALLFYGTATFCRTGCRILRAWTEPRHRRLRRKMRLNQIALQARLMAPHPSNGKTPAWFRGAAGRRWPEREK